MTEPKTRILVVDDDLRLRDLLQRYLSEQGFAVHTVSDAAGMDKLLSRERVDLLVLDLMLPGEDGLTLCRKLRAESDTPVVMLTAPGPAAQRCLAKAGMAVGDIDLWEVNEAFAAVPLKTMRDLDLDPETVNVNGGAIALGHPIGATGAMLLGTVLDELERRDLTTGLVTMCTGGGMGTATIVERV